MHEKRLSLGEAVQVMFTAGYVTVIPVIVLLTLLENKVMFGFTLGVMVGILLLIRSDSPWRNLLIASATWLGVCASMLVINLATHWLSLENEKIQSPALRWGFFSCITIFDIIKIYLKVIDNVLFICYNCFVLFVKVMKHPVSQRHNGNGVELLQAMFTLLVLSGIYVFSTTYSGNTASIRDIPTKPAILSAQYWNDTIGYGFTSIPGDTYAKSGSSEVDQVTIHPWDGVVYNDQSVRVSFYSRLSIEDIEQKNTQTTPRTYSRLPGGIAMIEWDLSSNRAKTILATLHSR